MLVVAICIYIQSNTNSLSGIEFVFGHDVPIFSNAEMYRHWSM